MLTLWVKLQEEKVFHRYLYFLPRVRNKDLKTVCCLSHSAEGPRWAQALEKTANFDPVSTWIFTFWHLKKANLKSCVVKTNADSKRLLFYLVLKGWDTAACFICVLFSTLPWLIVGWRIICGGGGFFCNYWSGKIK